MTVLSPWDFDKRLSLLFGPRIRVRVSAMALSSRFFSGETVGQCQTILATNRAIEGESPSPVICLNYLMEQSSKTWKDVNGREIEAGEEAIVKTEKFGCLAVLLQTGEWMPVYGNWPLKEACEVVQVFGQL